MILAYSLRCSAMCCSRLLATAMRRSNGTTRITVATAIEAARQNNAEAMFERSAGETSIGSSLSVVAGMAKGLQIRFFPE